MINRKKKITWSNPSHNQNVSTYITKIFSKLVDKHFPRTNTPIHQILNNNTEKSTLAA